MNNKSMSYSRLTMGELVQSSYTGDNSIVIKPIDNSHMDIFLSREHNGIRTVRVGRHCSHDIFRISNEVKKKRRPYIVWSGHGLDKESLLSYAGDTGIGMNDEIMVGCYISIVTKGVFLSKYMVDIYFTIESVRGFKRSYIHRRDIASLYFERR